MEGMPVLVGAAGLVALLLKLLDWVKLTTNLPASLRKWMTLTAAFALGVVVVFMYGASQLGGFDLGTGIALVDMNGWTKTIVGLALGASAAAAYDFKSAIDSSDSAKHPPLKL
jgi:ABC-type amino acid transport system permease subunit